jgi:hypothetical protein
MTLLVSISGCAEQGTPPTQQPDSESATPPGSYTVRLDSERSDPGQFRPSEADGSIRILTGPTGIAFRRGEQVLSGDFRVEATFIQYGAPVGYREAYGIFIGGRNLYSPDQEYTYLLVRPTGYYLIQRRIGDVLETLVDWTSHQAIRIVADEGYEPENTLTVEVVRGETRFQLNGTEVHTMPASETRPYGVAGLRANHRLNIRVTGWSLMILDSEQ